MRIGNNTKSKFKGVLKHANGHWGTQIYVIHNRIWLGTHKTEIEAAMAYDSASIRFKPGDNQRNFPWSSVTKHEPMFQKDYSSEEIVDMLKHGTYTSKFFDFLRTQNEGQDLGPSSNQDYSGFSCKLLFQKELTPSDVSKLNRLVVPKKYAVKYFPRIVNAKEDNKEVERPEDVHVVFKDMTTSANASEINKKVDKMNEVNLVFKDRTHIANSNEDNREVEKTDEVHLVFKDRMNREWKFRYCYWQSSQSYVFTRGWNRFVKENKLNANDTIAFYACESRKRKTGKEKESFWLIDIGFPSETRDVRVMEEIGENVDPQVDLRLRLGRTVVKEEEEKLVEDQVLTKFEATAPAKPARRVILFGSQIN